MDNTDTVTQASAPPVFSVVIPTRNRPDILVDAVASVLEQTFSDLELIVSDNSQPA
ncbi:glycosyltransferase, partial [Ensifer sp. SSB1]|uniref:glycosyltransferase family 2 protein n=1 Tax=Ensifer sp. SSB1 TaxID=2795385 RepID=UPI001A449A87